MAWQKLYLDTHSVHRQGDRSRPCRPTKTGEVRLSVNKHINEQCTLSTHYSLHAVSKLILYFLEELLKIKEHIICYCRLTEEQSKAGVKIRQRIMQKLPLS